MNSLNLLSGRIIGTTSISRPRAKSQGDELVRKLAEELPRGRSYSSDKLSSAQKEQQRTDDQQDVVSAVSEAGDEKTPLLEKKDDHKTSRLHLWMKQIANALTAILVTLGSPIVYVARCFKDENGLYSALVPFKRRGRRKPKVKPGEMTLEKPAERQLHEAKPKGLHSDDTLNSSDDALDLDHKQPVKKKPEDPGHIRRSSRIRLLQNDDAVRRQRKRNSLSSEPLTVDTIKSPISASTASKLRYPHAPVPPRPLVPRRQPSYSDLTPIPRSLYPHLPQKTLILDLDETLIHSYAKGNRMSSGHMVEVKLNTTVINPVAQVDSHGQPIAASAPQILGPQHPILYYVHKRPHCDTFLRKTSRWFNLVIFTASVQEYADPVIDWLETERKYFTRRLYRPDCTFRQGSYVKDLARVEPDLGRVIILDNSPISYVFHEGQSIDHSRLHSSETEADILADNAIPIEGWINDPSDNDLLHLIPLLEGLQYVTDVRALLALRRGEAVSDGIATSAAA